MTQSEYTIFHSPDADDAFMFYGLTSGAVTHPRYKFLHDLCDIESLNERTLRAELDCTAVSVHALAHLGGRYDVLTCGASMGGKDYGPRVVARSADVLNSSSTLSVASPGRYTSAHLALELYAKEADLDLDLRPVPFDQVEQLTADGECDLGIIIHEGQLTFADSALTLLVDLGEWWFEKTGLPLPLGVNVVKSSHTPDLKTAFATVLYESISYSLEHREPALQYALQYGRGIGRDTADTFVGMYVNELTLDLGDDGKRSIRLFLEQAHAAELIPEKVEPVFIEPSS